MIREVVISMLISVISGCTLPDWKIDNKDKRYAGKWYIYKQRMVQDYQEAISRCLYGEFYQETRNPLKWTAVYGYNDKTTGKDEIITLHGSSEQENSGQYSYKPPLEVKGSIVCGDVDGVRMYLTIGYLKTCPEKDLALWIGFEKRRNSTHPPTSEEQKKIDECLKRNQIDPESLSLIDNDNCTN